MMYWEQPIQYASRTDIGFRRRNNQDSLAVHICSEEEAWTRRGHLFIVADGMGGHAVGELASKIAIDTIPLTFYKDQRSAPVALKAAIEAGNEAIHKRGSMNQDFAQMGTTCTTLNLGPDGAWAGHVGDSRLYRVRRNRIEQLTFDHSLQWELLRQGKLPREDVLKYHPRNVITRSLGPEENVETDIEGPFDVAPNDAFLLCSDGLTTHVEDSEIGATVRALPVEDACRFLVNLANLRGGSDNISVVVVRVGEVPAGADLAPKPEVEPHDTAQAWLPLIVGWISAALFILGGALFARGNHIPGAVFVFFSLFAAAMLVARWLMRQKAEPETELPANLNKQATSPYRTASAKLTREFLSHIEKLGASLQRSALDEGWSADWSAYQSETELARKAINDKDFAAALAAFARAIDQLMVWLLRSRKERNRKEKWGPTQSAEAHTPATE